MFYELLRFSFVLVLVLVVVGISGAILMRTVLLVLLSFVFVVEMKRGDESDGLFERMRWIFSDQKVYESGDATE